MAGYILYRPFGRPVHSAGHLYVQGDDGPKGVPDPPARPRGTRNLQAHGRPRRRGDGREDLRPFSPSFQRGRPCLPVGITDAAGLPALQSGRIAGYELASGVQHGRKLRLQYELAGVFGRAHAVLSVAVSGAHRPELCVGGERDRRSVCPNQGIYPEAEKDHRQLLGGPDEDHAVCAAAPLLCGGPAACLPGRGTDIQPL